LKPYRWRVALTLCLTTLACLLNLPVPLLIQGIVDHIVTTGELSGLPTFAAILFAVFLTQAGVGLINTILISGVGLAIVRELRHRLYDHLQRLSLSFYDRTSTGSILSRLVDDVAVVQALITTQTITLVTDLGTTLTIAALLLVRSPRVALVILIFLPLYAANFRWFTRRIRTASEEVRRRLDGVFDHLKEKLDGTLVVKSHAREVAEIDRFAAQLGELHGPRVRADRLGAAFSNIGTAIGGVGVVAVFAVAALEVLHGRMTPGGVVSTAALAGLLFGPVGRLADLANIFEHAAASLDRLGEILDLGFDVVEPASPLPLTKTRGLVEFDRVGFGYEPGKPVVWDVRLRIDPGMRVALVGPTGCGKTTLTNLLLRFYDPTWGEIRIDGLPIRLLSTADLRRQIGVVLQEPMIFRQSLADNIRYGNPGASDAEVEAAARAALIHQLAESLPEGYHTVVGEGAYKLSQGERQRLSIARAFCKNPSIVILDEATSALDTASESLIHASLCNLLRGRTSLIIAHRLSTIVDADLIVVIDGGLVVQKGTHAQLLAETGGLYRRLCLQQFRAADRMRHEGRAASAIPRPHLLEDGDPLPRRTSA
jgi:ABC-type multidrug transport system fused ATPase/permease subunit